MPTVGSAIPVTRCRAQPRQTDREMVRSNTRSSRSVAPLPDARRVQGAVLILLSGHNLNPGLVFVAVNCTVPRRGLGFQSSDGCVGLHVLKSRADV